MSQMTTAHAIAIELRKIADALDKDPEQPVISANLSWNCKYIGSDDKPSFLALARLLPRPLSKGVQDYDSDALEITHSSPALTVTAAVKRSKVCRLITPAKTIEAVYDCEPLLSQVEEESLTA